MLQALLGHTDLDRFFYRQDLKKKKEARKRVLNFTENHYYI